MIRFCDKEVCCIVENELNRKQLIEYFLNGHRNELVCILDEEGKYTGKITYDSLLGKDIRDSINSDYLVLDKNIWKNGRKYFSQCKKEFGGVEFLPVLDKEHHLLCFAWQDDEANRELRMLDELMNCCGALDFKEFYSEVDCVIVDGCNELAYFLIKYLKNIGVLVYAPGKMWKAIGIDDIADVKTKEETLDYRRLTIYSEGIEPKTAEKRSSVSAEFECIDLIYEENIRRGLISDTTGNFQSMLENIKGKQIAIIGIGENSLNAYDFLLENGIDINCFILEKEGYQEKRLFDKQILTREEAEKYAENLIFVETCSKYSAWGFGGVDFYYYLGYKRNEKFFLLQDYIDIPKRGLLNVMNNIMKLPERKLILTGDIWLCLKLRKILENQNGCMRGRIVYCDVLGEYTEENKKMILVDADEICGLDICLLLTPGYYGCRLVSKGHIINYGKTRREKYLIELKKYNVNNILLYPVENFIFIKDNICKIINQNSKLKIKKIILGSIVSHSGNDFFRGLLDNHSQIVMIGKNYLSNNLYSICIRLATERADDILSLFWKLYNEGQLAEWEDDKKARFSQSMKEMLDEKDKFSSQELFIMIHISYAKIWRKEIEDMSRLVIYWEPHNISRVMLENYAEWLGDICDSGYLINIVRNTVMRAGSCLKFTEKIDQRFSSSGKDIFLDLLFCRNIEKEYDGWKRLLFRFEDLKCKPQKELERLCDELEIAWSDTLLETTENGKKSYVGNVTGFDLAPVYYEYEEYFSSFDRFRISLILAAWQKKYGYPYVNSLRFSRRELQEMFAKKFRFEAKLRFSNVEEEMEFQMWKKKLLCDRLWMNRRMEICE